MRKQVMLTALGLVFVALLAGCSLGSSPAPAALKVEPAGALDFGDDKDEVHLFIDNSGKKTLEWTIVVVGGEDWLQLDATQGVNRGTVVLRADRTGLDPGSTHQAELTAKSNGGDAKRTVTMHVPTGPAVPGHPPLAKVRDLTVTGFTVPAGVLPPSSGTFGGDAAYDVLALHDLVGQFNARVDGTDGGRFKAPAGRVGSAALPAGYDALFVLSWRAVDGADGYRLFAPTDADGWSPVAEVDSFELEYNSDGYAVYVHRGDFNSGDAGTYKVQAVGAGGSGEVSDDDTGVIIAPQRLVSPADDSAAPSRPRFEWRAHPDGTAYGLYVAQGERGNHVWQQNFNDGVTTRATYPGDDPHAAPELAPGSYLWYVAASGPVANGKVTSISISGDWTFDVANGDD